MCRSTSSARALTRSSLAAKLLPGLRVLQSWFQGTITYSHHTRGVTESVAAFLLACGGILGVGVAWGQIPGLYVGLIAVTAGLLLQTGWLWWRMLRRTPVVYTERAV